MSDKVKERIENDADKYIKRQGTHDRPDITKHDYIQGATAERPKAWNEAIDEALELLIHYSGAFTSVRNFESLKSELEALKHKQP